MAGQPWWYGLDVDLYSELGLSPDADDAAVQGAWWRTAAQHHPDRGGDPGRFRNANIAYLVLSDPAQRRAYDIARAARARPAAPAAPAAGRHAHPPDRGPVGGRPDPLPTGTVMLAAFTFAIAVVLSYLWPLFTIVTGAFVVVFVAVRYYRHWHPPGRLH